MAMISRRSLSIGTLAGAAVSLVGDVAKAKTSGSPVVAERLDRIAIVAGDLDRLARFYTLLGFVVDDARPAPEHAALAQASSATSRSMRLGEQIIELVAFNPPGAAYPWPGKSSDPWFQHISLVAPDMGEALARLSAAEGWSPISRQSPVELSPVLMAKFGVSGSFAVYKFRDPEGHPLEFASAAHPAPPWSASSSGLLGYDHSALGVTDVDRSIRFYRDELGLTQGLRVQSTGPEQSAADGLTDAKVDIVEMLPGVATPHIEFLGYHDALARAPVAIGPRDSAATRLVLTAHGVTDTTLRRDPDGHWLQLVAAS
jgi:catechol 2,3-dioxygenase-like lactoylglutathione lyase family enzyme